MQKNKMMKLINHIWSKRRDLISQGFDESLDYISKIIPLKVHKIPSGTKCWTWTVPEKWEVNEAYIEDLDGNRIIDLKNHALHVVSYSLAVDKIVSKEELLKHIYTNPKTPDAIPFEFKYYERDWGFCIQHNRLKEFTKDKYRVFIDSKSEKGNLKIGDHTIKGKTEEIIVLVAHLCHPVQVNDGLSAVAVLLDIAKEISKKNPYYTYKFLIIPETIGSIAYLSQNEEIIPKLKYGIFLDALGSDDSFVLQLSRQGNTRLDRIARYVMERRLNNFTQGGFRKVLCNDEIVFNGPGVNIPMVAIGRFPFAEHHTSNDNLDIISEQNLEESKSLILEILEILDKDYFPKRQFKGPIFLSGYDLWIDWRTNRELNKNIEQIMLRLEGGKTVFDIAEELDMEFNEVLNYINKFFDKGLIKKL